MVNMINTIKDIPKEELLTGGTFSCSGCQPIYSIRLLLKALGKNTILINAAGCMTLTATYPFTPYHLNWVFNAIENAASTASGILMGLKAQNKEKDINIVCHVGDGATADIGLQSLSGVFDRKENIIYITYDNENFANTGHQRTSETPYGARTKTTEIGKINQIGNTLFRKSIVKIAAAHNIPYIATACTSYPMDLIKKVQKASKINGPKFIHILTPCMPGWLIKDDEGPEIGKLAVETGAWPLYEIENGKFLLNHNPEKLKPVSEYLQKQGRFKHLKEKDINYIQSIVNKQWESLLKGNYWDMIEY